MVFFGLGLHSGARELFFFCTPTHVGNPPLQPPPLLALVGLPSSGPPARTGTPRRLLPMTSAPAPATSPSPQSLTVMCLQVGMTAGVEMTVVLYLQSMIQVRDPGMLCSCISLVRTHKSSAFVTCLLTYKERK